MAPFEWQLPALIAPREGADEARFALVMLNQPIRKMALVRELWQRSCLRVAADGGANELYELSREASPTSFFDSLDAIVGDLDSLTPSARAYFESRGTAVIHNPDQESTDFGKALLHVRATSGTPIDIAALGGLGGRVDQGLSQLHHLFHYQPGAAYDKGRIYLISEESITMLLKAGKHAIHVRDGEEHVFGKHVGILPIREPSVITTRGLEWDVEGWETAIGGRLSTSNHVLPETRVVEVETSKDVLFTISLK